MTINAVTANISLRNPSDGKFREHDGQISYHDRKFSIHFTREAFIAFIQMASEFSVEMGIVEGEAGIYD